MAYCDYWHCAVCDAKAFYDANIDWPSQRVGKAPENVWNGPLSEPPYRHGCSVVALCEDCWKTHEIKVEVRTKSEHDLDAQNDQNPKSSTDPEG